MSKLPIYTRRCNGSAVAQSPGQVHRRLRVSNPGDHGKPGSHRQRLEWERR